MIISCVVLFMWIGRRVEGCDGAPMAIYKAIVGVASTICILSMSFENSSCLCNLKSF